MQTLNISLPTELVKRVDLQAKKEYKNRSELMREALRLYLVDQDEWMEIFKSGEEAMKKMGIRSEGDINDIVYEFRHGKKVR
ncbi:MAG: ribbon-helix-helix domain-containing protein [Candidatus Daviesbacteria bacterium]|nr:ribbon-helix-helix domain-containing protein [Candidatus Daviesbacteria bacterium]